MKYTHKSKYIEKTRVEKKNIVLNIIKMKK